MVKPGSRCPFCGELINVDTQYCYNCQEYVEPEEGEEEEDD